MKTRIPPVLITFALVCFAVVQNTQAVSPPPDGGYPGFNTAEGQKALFSLTTGSANAAVGWYSLFSNTEGTFNTATGAGTLLFNTGDQNTAFGAAALLFNTGGFSNTAVGATALLNNTSNNNTAIGDGALSFNSTGELNTAIGYRALSNNTTGDSNTVLGAGAGFNVTTASNVICIGRSQGGENVSDSCYIGNIYGTFNTAQSAVVYIDPDGRLGTGPSARRFKKDIADMGAASEVLLSMRPVTFHFKTQDTEKAGREISQFGLIAEEVAEVNPDLILRDKEGEIYSVRYDAVNAMLLNEFLKEHRAVAELKSTVAEQRKGMEAMAAQLKEQAAQIQKVSAQLEVNKAAPQTVLNNQ